MKPELLLNFPEPCGVDWHGHWLRVALTDATSRLYDAGTGQEIPYQLLPTGEALCRVDLSANGRLQLAWERTAPRPVTPGVTVHEEGDTLVLNTGEFAIRLAMAFAPAREVDGPILGVRGREGAWLGRGKFVGPVAAGTGQLKYVGPLAACYEAHLTLADGGSFTMTVEVYAGEAFAQIRERMATTGDAEMRLDITGFTPTRLLTGGLPGAPAALVEAQIYLAPYGVIPHLVASLGAQQIFGQLGAPWLALADETHAIGCVIYAGGDWQYPGDNTLHLLRRSLLTLTGEARHGMRTWLLVAGEAARWMPAEGASATALAALKTRMGDLPLNKIRQWVLEIEDEKSEPCLWTDRAGVEAARVRLQAPEWDRLIDSIPHQTLENRIYGEDECRCFALIGTTDSFPVGIRWLKTGEKNAARELVRQIAHWAMATATRFARQGLQGVGLDVVFLRTLKLILYWYDLLRGTGLMSAEEARQIRRALLFCAYCVYDRDYFNYQSAYAPAWSAHSLRRFLLEEDYSDTMGCQNFHSDNFAFIGAVGLVWPQHPMAHEWIEHAEAMALTNLEYFVAPDGTYVESDNYYQHFLGLLYYLGVALARAGRPAVLRQPRLRAGLAYFVRAQTPRLRALGNPQIHWYGTYTADPQARPLVGMPPLGDAGFNWGSQAMPAFLRHAANVFAATDPQLAGWLEWTWQRGGRPLASYSFNVQEFVTQQATGPAPVAYPLASEEMDGHGVMMRAAVDGPRETAVLVSAGRATSHMHYDGGSIILWHAGAPLVVDPGHIVDELTPIRQYAGDSWRHATITFACDNVRRQFADAAPPVFANRLHNGYTGMEHRPPPRAVRLGEEFDYVACDLSQNNVREGSWRAVRRTVSIEHYRQVLFAKNRYLVIKDRIYRSIYPATWHLHVMADTERIADQWVRFIGRYGADLQVTFVQPSRPDLRVAPHSIVRHLSVRQEPERDFLVVLQPLLPDEEPYAVTPMRDGVQVSGPGWTDRVLLDALPGLAAAGEWHSSQRDTGDAVVTLRPGYLGEGQEQVAARCAVIRNGLPQIIHG